MVVASQEKNALSLRLFLTWLNCCLYYCPSSRSGHEWVVSELRIVLATMVELYHISPLPSAETPKDIARIFLRSGGLQQN